MDVWMYGSDGGVLVITTRRKWRALLFSRSPRTSLPPCCRVGAVYHIYLLTREKRVFFFTRLAMYDTGGWGPFQLLCLVKTGDPKQGLGGIRHRKISRFFFVCSCC